MNKKMIIFLVIILVSIAIISFFVVKYLGNTDDKESGNIDKNSDKISTVREATEDEIQNKIESAIMNELYAS